MLVKKKKENEQDEAVVKRRTSLYNKYILPNHDVIYKICAYYSSRKENVMDNFQSVLMNFFRGIETYDETRPLQTWINIVAKRYVIAMEKREAQQGGNGCFVDFEQLECLSDDDAYSIKSFLPGNYTEAFNPGIRRVLEAMRRPQRDALLLQLAGYSLKEIQAIENSQSNGHPVSLETIKSRLFLARAFLKKHLNEDGTIKEDSMDIIVPSKNIKKIDEPYVSFKATSDLDVYEIRNKDIDQPLITVQGYAIKTNINMAYLKTTEDLDAAVAGITKMIRDLIIEKLLANKKQKDEPLAIK